MPDTTPPANAPAAAVSRARLPLDDRDDEARVEQRALAVLAVVALVTMTWIARPVGLGILLGTLIAFSLQDHYARTVRRRGRPAVTALGYVLAATIALLAIIVAISTLFVSRGTVMIEALVIALEPGGGLYARFAELATHYPWLSLDDATTNLQDVATNLASGAASIATAIVVTSYHVALTLFFAMMTLALVLRHWGAFAQQVENLLPLRRHHTRELLEEFRRVGRTTLLGTVLTGLAQGVFAAIGYALTGVPEAAFFGAATAVASLLPGIGTMLVWLPAGVYLIATGHPAMGVLEIVWAAATVIGVSDYVIRPRLVGQGGEMPSLLTFAALFGGVEVFGLAGLLIGPLLMSVSYAVLTIYVRDLEGRRAGATGVR